MEEQFVNVTKDGGVTKRVVVEGSGELPPSGANVQSKTLLFYFFDIIIK